MAGKSGNSGDAPSPYGVAFDDLDISSLMTDKGHGGLLHTQFHALGPDWVELAVPWNERIAIDAGTGVLACGPLISLLDNATGMAVWQRRGWVTHQVTVDLRLDYRRMPPPGRTIIGRGMCTAIDGDLALVHGIAYEDSPDDPVAMATGSYMQIGQG
jgi:acyl-coenzyme A thioesterase PaaI-like protein